MRKMTSTVLVHVCNLCHKNLCILTVFDHIMSAVCAVCSDFKGRGSGERGGEMKEKNCKFYRKIKAGA